jgi:transposase-like protein
MKMCNFVYDDVDSGRKGVALTEGINIIGSRNIIGHFYRKGVNIMGKHYNPLEKEFLIRSYKSNGRIKLGDFCVANNVSDGAFKKWLKQYDEGGLEGLARADAEVGAVLPEGIDRTEESYKREILKLRIENERLKKNYMVRTNENGEQEFVRLKAKNST